VVIAVIPSVLLIEELMNKLHAHRTLSHRRGDPLDRSGAYVAHSKKTGTTTSPGACRT